MCIIDPSSIVLCASLSCGLLTTSYLASNIKKFPHPSECGLIGRVYRISGLHSHDPADLIVDIQEAVESLENGEYFVEVRSGRLEYRTHPVKTTKGKLEIYEKLNVHVRQCDDFLVISLFRKHTFKNKLWGETQISVDEEILAGKPPRMRRYTLFKDNEPTSKIMLSIFKMDDSIANVDLSPLALQVVIQAQREGNVLEGDVVSALDDMDDAEKLRFFSKVISGPIKKMNTLKPGFTEYFFKPFEVSPGYWHWCFWDSIDDYNTGKEQKGSISFHTITLIIPDPANRKRFYLRYRIKGGVYGVVFKTTDRDRDIWIDGLNEFVQKANDLYVRNPQFKLLKNKRQGVRVTKSMDLTPSYLDIKNHKFTGAVAEAVGGVGNRAFRANLPEGAITLASPMDVVLTDESKLKKNLEIMEYNLYRADSKD